MSGRARMVKYVGWCLAAMLVASCATTSLVDTWRNPDVSAVKRYHKLLISSTGRNLDERRVYEDVIASELRQHGIQAVASYPLMQPEGEDKVAALNKAMQLSGADGVLNVRTTMVEQKVSIVPGYGGYPDFWYPPAFHTWNMNGYYGTSMLYEPPAIIAYTVATMQANLFDSASGKLAWAISMETTEPGKVLSVSRDMAHIIIQSLVKEGLI